MRGFNWQKGLGIAVLDEMFLGRPLRSNVNGDGKVDIVGFGNSGVDVLRSSIDSELLDDCPTEEPCDGIVLRPD